MKKIIYFCLVTISQVFGAQVGLQNAPKELIAHTAFLLIDSGASVDQVIKNLHNLGSTNKRMAHILLNDSKFIREFARKLARKYPNENYGNIFSKLARISSVAKSEWSREWHEWNNIVNKLGLGKIDSWNIDIDHDPNKIILTGVYNNKQKGFVARFNKDKMRDTSFNKVGIQALAKPFVSIANPGQISSHTIKVRLAKNNGYDVSDKIEMSDDTWEIHDYAIRNDGSIIVVQHTSTFGNRGYI